MPTGLLVSLAAVLLEANRVNELMVSLAQNAIDSTILDVEVILEAEVRHCEAMTV